MVLVCSVTTQILAQEKKTSNAIESDITYSAKDSIIMVGSDVAILYGDAVVKYQTMELKADYIRLSLDSNIVYASGVMDSTGKYVGTPVFKDGAEVIESKSMKYHIKTKKGFVYGTVTQQGEGYVQAEKTKKVDDDVYCLQNGKYTTCDNHEHPHFYFALTKAKMKQGKYIVSGPAYMVIEDLPTPLALPFGYFPVSQTYSSGILFPTLGDEYNRGFYAKGLGYYFAICDYLDLAITSDIYSKGSWGLSLASSYKWRYKFSGKLNLSFISNVTGEKHTPSYKRSQDFRFLWSHTQDPKSSPYTTFSASVNFATSSYAQNDVDSYYNPSVLSQNTKSSTVTLTQRFPESPFTLSMSLYVNQRTSDSTINLQLPSLSLSMSRQYPFKRKKAVGKAKWYEKIALTYNMNLTNSTTAKESEFKDMQYLRDWKVGVKHSLPISASFTLFKYLNMNFSLNNNLKWYFQRIDQRWEGGVDGAVARDTTYGFYNIYQGNVSLGFQTQLFGFYTLKSKSGKKMPVFRHKLVPSVSFSYSPDYGHERWGYWSSYERPASDGTMQTVYYDRYASGVYGGSPSRGRAAAISFNVANNLEMKYWGKNDTTDTGKKITIIDNFSFGTSYNFVADSLNWSNVNANLRLKFLDKFSLNLDMIFDPYTYQLNSFGNPVKVNVSQFEKNKVLFRLMSTGTSFGYTFSNATFKRKDKKTEKPKEETYTSELENTIDGLSPLEENNVGRQAEKTDKELGYQEFKVPWSLTLNYSIRYGYGDFNPEIMEYDRELTHNLSISGNIKFTPTWSASFSTYYDITNNKWNYMNCSISKDLHCWQMSISFVPLGKYKTYDFMIGVKSSMLKDLKFEKESDTSNLINWY
ncbi:MAG: putative LPS assembly protein LptD [Paludibacteraceae bacterium]|nr:putative LPS assembly protein LptD [Paludibacteraceae bacterium]